jgi:hypothetical protein
VNEWLDVLATSLIATVNTKHKVIGYVTTIRWVYYHPGPSMVILRFVASFLLALAVSYVISRLFRESAEAILSRLFAKHVSAVVAKYLQLVIVFLGVSSGTRIRLLEVYIDAPP